MLLDKKNTVSKKGKDTEIFKKYARYYDNFYAKKNYQSEAEFILYLAKQQSITPRKILEIGCGTGGHIIPLAKKGIFVKGFDLSKDMIEVARQKILRTKIKHYAKVEVGNAKTYRDNEKYDLVLSMFAAMGYLTSNQEFFAGLTTAYEHLNENGLFIFDIWFGPAVLSQKPEIRIQEFKKNNFRTIRLVRPELSVIEQVVTINYKIICFNDNQVYEEVNESHKMRYFFIQELKLFLSQAGLELVKVCPFMKSSREPNINDWNISIVSKKLI